MRVVGPRIEWCADHFLVDIDEASILEQLAGVRVVRDWAVHPLRRVGEVVVPADDCAVGSERLVGTAGFQIDLDVFYPALAGLQVSVVVSLENAPMERLEAHAKIFWYKSGQLQTLPQAMRR
jgi:hypothetical protein